MSDLHATPYRILVCGSRDYNDISKVSMILRRYRDSHPVIIHGAARGADACASLACRVLGYEEERHPANWKKYGKAAGPIRNREMLDSGIDLVLAFWDGKSPGTRNMMAIARKAGVEVKVYR